MENRVSRIVYVAVTWLFCAGILAQVFFVGLSLLGGRPSWDEHMGLGHILILPALLMIIFAYVGRLPRPMKWLTWVTVVLYLLLADIVVFMTDTAPTAAALHPVLAVLLFFVAGTLAARSWVLVRAPDAEADAERSQPVTSPAPR